MAARGGRPLVPRPPSRRATPASRRPPLPPDAAPRAARIARCAAAHDAAPTAEAQPRDDPRARFRDELHRAKLDALKELAYGASHEVNNPLANIALRAQTLLKRPQDAETRRALEAIHRAAMRAHEMISDLMLFARPPAPNKSRVALRPIAAAVADEAAVLAAQRDIRVSLREGGGEATADADPTQLAVAVRALIDNAIEAIGRGGVVTVWVLRRPCGGSEIVVADDGPGVPPAVAAHAFDPFFSGREAGRGLGFGLAKCWRIVTLHGGDVRLESGATGGATATITLPAPDAAAAS